MITKDTINVKIDEIKEMLLKLRNDMFMNYSFKKFGNKGLNEFNTIYWQLNCLKNIIKEFK